MVNWLSENESKAECERIFLYHSVLWIFCFGIVVVTQVYKDFNDPQYLTLGFLLSFPFILYPLFFPGKADKKLPILDRYFVKANIWIGIFGFVGNYFWTHYFYTVLGATYSFPVNWQLNKVPIFLYFVTHAYFVSYHTVTTIFLRRFWNVWLTTQSKILRIVFSILVVFLLGIFTAFMEAFTVASVPYYNIENRFLMYTIGSIFYGIYFYVSFPMFYNIDEKKNEKWSISYTFLHSLAASMIVTIILDFWRLILGSIRENDGQIFEKKIFETLPWLQ